MIKVHPWQPPTKRKKPKGYWLDKEKRREYFTRFAELSDFDPQYLANWENITKLDIKQKMVSS